VSATNSSDTSGNSDESSFVDVIDEVVLPGDFNGNGIGAPVDEEETTPTSVSTDVNSDPSVSEPMFNVVDTETPAAFKGAIAVDGKTGKQW
jgi:hypothetical protein